jgi:hypothetical protein
VRATTIIADTLTCSKGKSKGRRSKVAALLVLVLVAVAMVFLMVATTVVATEAMKCSTGQSMVLILALAGGERV